MQVLVEYSILTLNRYLNWQKKLFVWNKILFENKSFSMPSYVELSQDKDRNKITDIDVFTCFTVIFLEMTV